MDKLSTNNITVKDDIQLNSDLKTNQLCIGNYCITEKDLLFMDEMPRYNPWSFVFWFFRYLRTRLL